MTPFEKALERILKHEGGYVNHPRDPGGATNLGITQRTLDAARMQMMDAGLPANVRDLTRKQAGDIYWRFYWTPAAYIAGDYADFALKFQLFDAYVNHSPSTVVKLLQRAVGAKDDGVMGPQTRAARHLFSQKNGDVVLAVAFLAERFRHWTNQPTFDDFGKGWTRRGADNLLYLAEDA
jgi:lysozyme family protein